jgi:3-oxoadipate enol-lactonase
VPEVSESAADDNAADDTTPDDVVEVEGGVAPPDLPPGRFVELDDRGTVVVRDFGAGDGPPLVLLHGWTATGDLNWFRCFRALGENHRVISFDHRGHGSGLRAKKPFRLEDCADDAVDIADALGVDRFIPVGYSMGGPIAQLVWRRHPERVAGLVLCATAAYFSARREERLSFLGLTGLAALARVTPETTRTWLTDQFYLQRKSVEWEAWAVKEVAQHEWRMILEAGRAIGAFSSVDWIGDVDVPVSMVVTMSDRVIRPPRQVELFELIENAAVYRVDGDHDVVVAEAERFIPSLLRATSSVVGRIGSTS